MLPHSIEGIEDRQVLNPQDILEKYRAVRGRTARFVETLEPEDCVIQSMPDVSPTRWHLAHSTWFFETFILRRTPGYARFDASFEYLFNSYYNSVGNPFPRERRGMLSRPTLRQVLEYRRHVDQRLDALLQDDDVDQTLLQIIELGLNHEQQHLELMHTDIKHVLFQNPTKPVFRGGQRWLPANTSSLVWNEYPDGLHRIGNQDPQFRFDNEEPSHRVFLESYAVANRLITSGEYLEFIEDRGYQRPELWLSDGWKQVVDGEWQAPLYWTRQGEQWSIFTLSGARTLRLDEPVCHVSYFEADAYARWAGARLPTEAEWEVVARKLPKDGNFLESETLHPIGAGVIEPGRVAQVLGDVWEWTSSPYTAYPGYRPVEGALGEYNGKFMCNQFVLRGGSCVTPRDHIRPGYRNFLPAEARWQFSGIRLAR